MQAEQLTVWKSPPEVRDVHDVQDVDLPHPPLPGRAHRAVKTTTVSQTGARR